MYNIGHVGSVGGVVQPLLQSLLAVVFSIFGLEV